MTYFTPTCVKNIFSSHTYESRSSKLESKKIPEGVGVDYVTPSEVDTPCNNIQIWRGVGFILNHLVEPTFPRDIMTKRLGFKVEVFDKESIVYYFNRSKYQDCRISAYPRLTQYDGIVLVAPSLVMIDLDHSRLISMKKLDNILNATLKRIYELLNVRPTVLWTGNGYHIYLPMDAFILEEEEIFAKFADHHLDPLDLSTKFMRFAEAFLTNNKHDPQHRPSINSCLLRVPGTYNSKSEEEVKVTQRWDGFRPSIKYMLREFRRYLIQQRLEAIEEYRKKDKVKSFIHYYNICNGNNKPIKIQWIDRLLQTAISDHRKYCIWRILAPYLINVRKLSDGESLSVMMTWLSRCEAANQVSFCASQRVKDSIRRARKIGYYPISLGNLKAENPGLCDLLQKEVHEA